MRAIQCLETPNILRVFVLKEGRFRSSDTYDFSFLGVLPSLGVDLCASLPFSRHIVAK